MKILKFGTVCEDTNGRLLFEHFSIDCEKESIQVPECYLVLCIERLQQELAWYERNRQGAKLTSPAP